jgi:hypothetical protein
VKSPLIPLLKGGGWRIERGEEIATEEKRYLAMTKLVWVIQK